MKTRTKTAIYVLCGLVFVGLVYGVCYVRYLGDIIGREAAAVCQIAHLRTELLIYHNKNRHWPSETKQIAPDPKEWIDQVSKKPLLYFPNARYWTDDVLLSQPEPYRSELWPFGKMKKYVILANGNCVDIYAD